MFQSGRKVNMTNCVHLAQLNLIIRERALLCGFYMTRTCTIYQINLYYFRVNINMETTKGESKLNKLLHKTKVHMEVHRGAGSKQNYKMFKGNVKINLLARSLEENIRKR